MKLSWIAGLSSLALMVSLGAHAASAAPDHCPPPHLQKAAHKVVKHHHRKHPAQPRYYEDEYAPPPAPPVPPPPPQHHFWRDGYGKAYEIGDRPWAEPPPCPCPPDHRGRLADVCRFNVWFGFNHHYGLESGL